MPQLYLLFFKYLHQLGRKMCTICIFKGVLLVPNSITIFISKNSINNLSVVVFGSNTVWFGSETPV